MYKDEQEKIERYLKTHVSHLSRGLGETVSTPCSIAALNLALTGEFIDEIPACVSPVVGKWVMYIQDAMPSELRNSDGWRSLLPLLAGTKGKRTEEEYHKMVYEWLWSLIFLFDATGESLVEIGLKDAWDQFRKEQDGKSLMETARTFYYESARTDEFFNNPKSKKVEALMQIGYYFMQKVIYHDSSWGAAHAISGMMVIINPEMERIEVTEIWKRVNPVDFLSKLVS